MSNKPLPTSDGQRFFVTILLSDQGVFRPYPPDEIHHASCFFIQNPIDISFLCFG